MDGQRLPTGQQCTLRTGQQLTFADVTFRADELSAPVARAVREDGGGEVQGNRLLAIPDADAPLATIHLAKFGGWVLETEQGVEAVSDGSKVDIGGTSWTLSLPVAVVRTIEEKRELTLAGATLTVQVSRNQESVAVQVRSRGSSVDMESRAHSYLLFLLARQLMLDQDRPADERGWVDQTILCSMLKVERRTLNVQVYRARQQFVQAGFVDGAQIIERRRASEELRLGVSSVHIS